MKYVCLMGIGFLFCQGMDAQSYTVTNLITNTNTGVGTDPNLVNPWGLSRPSKSTLKENEWWASDNVSGLSTLYYVDKGGNSNITPLTISIPPAGATGTGSPTGTAFNPSNNNFAFVTLDGTLQNWNAGQKPAPGGTGCYKCHVSSATIMVNHSGAGASYQGLTIAKNATSKALTYYVANNNGGVEAYDATSFSPVTLPAGAFTDSRIPNTYAPAGIQAIGASIYVTYNAIAGGGTGFVDVFNTNGKLQRRLADGWFNQPWGVALAPATGFGTLSGAVLIGNTGSGWIGAYNASTGAFISLMQSSTGDLTIPGLWGLEFGDGNAESGPTTVLYFNGGGNNQTSGVFGAITAP